MARYLKKFYKKPLGPMLHGTDFLGILHSLIDVEFKASFGQAETPMLGLPREMIWRGAKWISKFKMECSINAENNRLDR